MSDESTNLSTFATTIKKGVQNYIKDLHTAMPGIIQSFDAVNQLATVQPAIKRIFVTRNEDTETLTPTDLPLLINVPVIYPRGGGFSLTFPVSSGDECLIVFCERAIDSWHQSGKVKKPSARRFHNLSDAVVFVGLSSLPNKINNYDPDNVVLRKDDEAAYIKVKSNNDVEITTNADIVADCDNISVDATTSATVTCPESTFNGNVTVNGNITCTGVTSSPTIEATTSLTVRGKEMHQHKHSQGVDSSGDSQQDSDGPI